MVRRLQIYIDEELDERLTTEAARGKTSKAALIRRGVRERFGQQDTGSDPLAELIGAYDQDPGGIDEVVYGG
ncbi:MAG TPA: CopG family transcriptional regulator [Candidatus Dormibacteraeota bacterium]|nr:CopG family transcriptional regulator [Candidatus Dormibacteraeota bacterium]